MVQLNSEQPLSEVKTETTTPKAKPKAKSKKTQIERTGLIPKDCQLDIDPPRINLIYNELLTLSVDQYPNACSVMLRVFIDLSIDNYITENNLVSEEDRWAPRMAKRLKDVVADMASKGKINSQLELAIKKIADGDFLFAASTTTFNQYVHNQYVFPKATELKMAWDELQPFVKILWSRV